VAVGGLAGLLLARVGIDVLGYVVSVEEVEAPVPELPLEELRRRREASALFAVSPEHEDAMKAIIDQAGAAGDTIGGVIEVRATNVPPGLGTHTQWCDRLDGRLAQALMSIPAVKGVEIGLGFESARRPGSRVHDEIGYEPPESDDDRLAGFRRETNNAGGIEGGMTNGGNVVARFAIKPIPSLTKPLRSVDLASKEGVDAVKERADVCVVAPAAIVGEAAVAFELARAVMAKFGGDSLQEVARNFRGYLEQLKTL
jgi:chorismate synthase